VEDPTPPRVRLFEVSRSRFSVAAGATETSDAGEQSEAGDESEAKVAAAGTFFIYRLSEPAGVEITVARRLGKGLRARGKCRRRSAAAIRQVVGNKKGRARAQALAKASCERLDTVGVLTRTGRKGENATQFTGRIGITPLAPAKYRATIRATDAGGNKSKRKRVSFTIVR